MFCDTWLGPIKYHLSSVGTRSVIYLTALVLSGCCKNVVVRLQRFLVICLCSDSGDTWFPSDLNPKMRSDFCAALGFTPVLPASSSIPASTPYHYGKSLLASASQVLKDLQKYLRMFVKPCRWGLVQQIRVTGSHNISTWNENHTGHCAHAWYKWS